MNLSGFSWRSVIAGVMAALAVSVVMALLGVALGAIVVDPMSDDPLAGVGLTFGLWSLFSMLVSLAVGGYVAGRLAVGRGAEHGFVTWATVLVVGVLFGGLAIGSAVSTAGTAVAGVTSGVVDHVADLADEAIESMPETINLQFNAPNLNDTTLAVLRDTEIPTLQPDYLRSQVAEAGSDLRAAVNNLRLNSGSFDSAIGAFVDRQQARLDRINADVDREAAITNLMQVRGISRPEAEVAVNNALAVYSRAVDSTRTTLVDARRGAEEARAHLATLERQARAKVEEFNSALAKSAVMAALAVIAGAAVATLAGMFANRRLDNRFVVVEETQEIATV